MERIDLKGTWDFVVDLDPKYHSDTRVAPFPSYARPNWNRRHWQPVQVPGVWNKYSERLDIYEGVCWFVREFEIGSLPDDYSARLRLGAVNYLCRVFLNGTEVGRHEGGYTAFTLDATGLLKEGINHIAVCVDNRATIMRFPGVLGYFNYGGIHRDVSLEIAGGPFFDEVAVEATPLEGHGFLRVTGSIGKASEGLHASLSCLGETITSPVSNDGTFLLEMAVEGAQTWSPDSPHLYPYEIRLFHDDALVDSDSGCCGFRRVEVKEGAVLLNGDRVRLKGICYVYDSPAHGVSPNTECIEQDIALMQELGVNAVRCHYPLGSQFYEAFDRAGIMVWIEPPIYCLHPLDDAIGTPFADESWQELARQMFKEMISEARNHPSVVIYGLGNECNTTNSEASSFFKTMAEYVRTLDSSRLLSYAALYGIVGEIADVVDILGVNSYWGWYDKVSGGKGLTPERTDKTQMEPIELSEMQKMLDGILQRKEIALLLTEFGADSIPGFLSENRELWSENYHADLLQEVFRLSEDYPQICGTFPFCFSDYRDPSKLLNGYWDGLNYKGVVTYDRRKKLPFPVVAERYGRV